MWLLCLETSTYEASVALAEDGKVAFEERFPGYTDLNRGFALRIKALLEKFSLRLKDIHVVAVSQGPGFFTSLRVGMAAAKALSYALSNKLVAVPTLWLYAASWKKQEGEALLTAHPANAREAFFALFKPFEEENQTEPKKGKEALLAYLSGTALSFGPVQARELPADLPFDGLKEVLVCGPFAERIFHNLVKRGISARIEPSLLYPPVSALACLAYGLLNAGIEEDPRLLKPLYLSPSQAERIHGVKVT